MSVLLDPSSYTPIATEIDSLTLHDLQIFLSSNLDSINHNRIEFIDFLSEKANEEYNHGVDEALAYVRRREFREVKSWKRVEDIIKLSQDFKSKYKNDSLIKQDLEDYLFSVRFGVEYKESTFEINKRFDCDKIWGYNVYHRYKSLDRNGLITIKEECFILDEKFKIITSYDYLKETFIDINPNYLFSIFYTQKNQIVKYLTILDNYEELKSYTMILLNEILDY